LYLIQVFVLGTQEYNICTGSFLCRITYKEIKYKPWFYFNHGIQPTKKNDKAIMENLTSDSKSDMYSDKSKEENIIL
jgi:hypothetical protein